MKSNTNNIKTGR